jgi:hypothetical protein
MRRHSLALAAAGLALALPACGGTTVANASTPVPSCTVSTLVASAPTKVATGSGSAIVTLAGTPSGDRFLVVWGPNSTAPRQAVVVRVEDGAPSVSSPVTVPFLGVAAFDGTAFDVIGAGLAFQRIDLDGRPLGPAVSPASSTTGIVGWPAATTSSGVAVVVLRNDPRSRPNLSVEADLLGTDGRLLRTQQLVTGYPDPYYGLGPIAAIAPHDGDAFVLSTNMNVPDDAVVLSAFGGSGQPPPSSGAGQAMPSYLFQLFPVGNRLAFPLNDGTQTWLWEGLVAGPFRRLGEVEPNAVDIAADGCGRIVTLSNPGWSATLSASAWGAGTQVQVATDFGGPARSDRAPLVPTSYGFGVAWNATDGIEFATLAWK